jgi:AcrR family transcriptional regulator
MPRKSSADKILQCATEMFAQDGYAGTIMDVLAQWAEVNKATIYYHFKDKEHLYEKVLVQHFEALATAVIEASNVDATALERLGLYIKSFAKESFERESLLSIIMQEISGGGDKMPNLAKAQMHKVLMLIKSILEQGEKEGVFMKADVLTIHFMVLGSLSFYITSAPMRKTMVSSDANIQNAFSNSTIEEFSDELLTMLTKALQK